ncbi:MAG TPA: amidohydrolase family protein, partial [Alphaproteobacteria bacterium]|nr:amidohydrolase family protein [Alphaproteobacteria bacterium]
YHSGPERLGASKNIQQEFWVVDGRLQAKEANLGVEDTSAESREMRDIDARLKHMDELEIDVQVLYPTLFLRPLTLNVRAERALTKSYNRWLAEIWKQAPDRLPWVLLPPLLSPISVIREELEWCKENGACGIFMRGLECERRLTDPYFHELYAAAEELDLMIGIHSGNGAFEVHDFYGDEPGFNKFKLPCVGAVHDLLMTDTPSMFPKLRWGFIEISAQWVPYMLNDLQLRLKRRGRRYSKDILKENNIFVACQVTDDLGYIVDYMGTDNLVIGTDYGHHDTSTQIEALRMIRDDGKLPADVVDNILGDNAARLYGFA